MSERARERAPVPVRVSAIVPETASCECIAFGMQHVGPSVRTADFFPLPAAETELDEPAACFHSDTLCRGPVFRVREM